MESSPLAPLISAVANSGVGLSQVTQAVATLQNALDKVAREAADAATEALLALANGAHVIAFCDNEKCRTETIHSVAESKAEGKYRVICNGCYSGRLEEELRVIALIHQTGKLAERRYANLDRLERWDGIERENDYLPKTKEERNRGWLRARSNVVRERKGSFNGGRVRARSNLRRR